MLKIIISIQCLLFFALPLKAEDIVYQTPNGSDFWRNIDDDFKILYEKSIDPDNLWVWGTLATSTALLYYYDEELITWGKDLGSQLGIKGTGEKGSNVILSLGPYPILKTPTNIGSGLYFIGDGSVHLGIMAGFLTYGYFNDMDSKALSVGSQLAEGLFDVGIATQFLKHTTGRQSPFKSTSPRGKWDLFPNQFDYANNVASYDAFPSGHLATTMMTITVLANNYPDNVYINPIGYTLMGLLSFQMLNNEVHWASDYPLAIAIGYTFGTIVSTRERSRNIKKSGSWNLTPNTVAGIYGLAIKFTY
jgi:hypothetical protein